MRSFLSWKIKIHSLKIAAFVFSGLVLSSFAVLSFADDSASGGKNIFQDTDQDGLSNDEEKLYGTDPAKADTDGDGYSDGTEVKSGYDPRKPAPGDKLMTLDDLAQQESIAKEAGVSMKPNLTEAVSRQVVSTLKTSSSKKETLSLDELRDTIQKTVSENVTPDALPEIDEKAIKVKKQKYSSLSDADRTAKIKQDTLEYSTAVSYILLNNSPIDMRSDSDLQKLSSLIMSNSISTLSGNNPTMLDEFSQKGGLITEQLKGLTVPENMFDMHVKALRLAQYMTTFKETIQSSGDNDPLAQINTMSKVQGLTGLLMEFTNEMQAKLAQYDIQVPI